MDIYDDKGKTVNMNDDLYDVEIEIRRLFERLCDSGIRPCDVALFMTEAVTTARCERALTRMFDKDSK